MRKETIYVRLLDEGVDVYRPVAATKLSENIYEMSGLDIYNPDDEVWEFLPGSRVIVREQLLSGERSLVAIKIAPE